MHLNSRARHKLHTIRDQRIYIRRNNGGDGRPRSNSRTVPLLILQENIRRPNRYFPATLHQKTWSRVPHQPPTATPAAGSSTDSSLEPCNICGGTEANGLVGIGLGLRMTSKDVEWVQCNSCDPWYHYLCLNIEDSEEIGKEFYCPCC